MTITEHPIDGTRPGQPMAAPDLYRDIHKGIRGELFALTTEAGRIDPFDRLDRAALAAQVESVTWLLREHAVHEEEGIQPVLVVHFPDMGAKILADHAEQEETQARLEALGMELRSAGDAGARELVQELYLEAAAFTGTYLQHQDYEERTVQPALARAIGQEGTAAVHGAIVASIPPDVMARSLAVMLPAMNVEDRAELLGGMRAEAPAEVFTGVWSLTCSVLDPVACQVLAGRLGIE